MMRIASLGLLTALAFTGCDAHAHLLHRQSATMKIEGHTANILVSVPVSAFDDVDKDGDGLLSPAELAASRDRIGKQFAAGFDVAEASNPVQRRLTWAVSPETHDVDASVDYVVVMHRVFFASPPRNPNVKIDLFGASSADAKYIFRASCGDREEEAILGNREREHTFFSSGAPCKSEIIPAGN